MLSFLRRLSTRKLFLRIDVCGLWPVLWGILWRLILASPNFFFSLVIVLLFEERHTLLIHYLALFLIPFRWHLSVWGGLGQMESFLLVNWKKKLFALEVVFLDHSQAVLFKWGALREKKKKGLLVKYVWKILFTAYFLGESQSTLLGKEKSEKLRNEETGLGVFNSVFPELCEHRALTSHQLSWKFLL